MGGAFRAALLGRTTHGDPGGPLPPRPPLPSRWSGPSWQYQRIPLLQRVEERTGSACWLRYTPSPTAQIRMQQFCVNSSITLSEHGFYLILPITVTLSALRCLQGSGQKWQLQGSSQRTQQHQPHQSSGSTGSTHSSSPLAVLPYGSTHSRCGVWGVGCGVPTQLAACFLSHPSATHLSLFSPIHHTSNTLIVLSHSCATLIRHTSTTLLTRPFFRQNLAASSPRLHVIMGLILIALLTPPARSPCLYCRMTGGSSLTGRWGPRQLMLLYRS